MTDIQRIGIYGGTFDPVHNAHVAMARTALEQAQLDLVLFVVSARPPHKNEGPFASPEDRYAMVCAALADEPQMEASRIELDRPGPSYTADTLRTVQKQYPEASLYLILGMDSLIDLPRWRQPDVILHHARLLVVPRPGAWEPPPSLEGHYDVLPFEKTPLSSTRIRARIAAGEPCEDCVPPAVMKMIREKGVYNAVA